MEKEEQASIVRLRTFYWSSLTGLHIKRSLTKIRKDVESPLEIEADATSAEDAGKLITNLNECPDGNYRVEMCDVSKDYETGELLSYKYKLVPHPDTKKKILTLDDLDDTQIVGKEEAPRLYYVGPHEYRSSDGNHTLQDISGGEALQTSRWKYTKKVVKNDKVGELVWFGGSKERLAHEFGLHLVKSDSVCAEAMAEKKISTLDERRGLSEHQRVLSLKKPAELHSIGTNLYESQGGDCVLLRNDDMDEGVCDYFYRGNWRFRSTLPSLCQAYALKIIDTSPKTRLYRTDNHHYVSKDRLHVVEVSKACDKAAFCSYNKGGTGTREELCSRFNLDLDDFSLRKIELYTTLGGRFFCSERRHVLSLDKNQVFWTYSIGGTPVGLSKIRTELQDKFALAVI